MWVYLLIGQIRQGRVKGMPIKINVPVLRNFIRWFGDAKNNSTENFEGKIKRVELEKALDFLISIEPDPRSYDDMEEYHAIMKEHADKIEKVNNTIRKFGEQIEPLTLESMQAVYYSIINSNKYRESAIHQSVATTALSQCWKGIGPWRN